MRAADEAADAAEALRAASAGAEEAIPDEYLDPLVATLMLDPVILPDSKVTVDRRVGRVLGFTWLNL